MLDLKYEEAKGTNRSWEYKDKKKGELGLHFNYQLLSYEGKSLLDLDTSVNSKIEEHQFRYIELEPYLNLHVTDSIILYGHHRSGHCLDCVYGNISKYPNENGVGIKLILFQN
jgi:hypothetical protein